MGVSAGSSAGVASVMGEAKLSKSFSGGIRSCMIQGMRGRK